MSRPYNACDLSIQRILGISRLYRLPKLLYAFFMFRYITCDTSIITRVGILILATPR